MRAKFIEHADAAFAVAENDEILAKQPHLDRRPVGLRHFLRQACRNPVAAHDLPHRCVAFDAAQQIVFFGGHHRGVSLNRTRLCKFLSRILS